MLLDLLSRSILQALDFQPCHSICDYHFLAVLCIMQCHAFDHITSFIKATLQDFICKQFGAFLTAVTLRTRRPFSFSYDLMIHSILF
jgi:hypothetical protein